MHLNIVELEASGGVFSHRYEPHELEFGDESIRLDRALIVSGHIETNPRGFFVKGELAGDVEGACDRCARSITIPVGAEFDLVYVTEHVYSSLDSSELKDDDLSLSTYDGQTLDLDDLAREQALLALPSHLLCSPQCKGLCPVCRCNWNDVHCDCAASQQDPRWADLAALINRQEKV
jgi:uncharacterized protein